MYGIFREDGKPYGWQTEAADGYILVSDADYELFRQHPDYVWDGSHAVEPTITPYVPSPQELILQQIFELEAQITVRRTREAILGTDNGWLADIDAQIAALRAPL